MSRAQRTMIDWETAETLAAHPDLLAIADAVMATQSGQRRPRRISRFVVAAVVLALTAAVALVSPWQGRGSGFVQRALGVLGDGQVIHVVSVGDETGQSIVDLENGSEQQLHLRTEVWFDAARGLQRTVTSINGKVIDQELQTPQGAWTENGRVYTCAWIAAHPLAATNAHVSCNASGDNGPTPRTIPETPPSLDPAIAGFVSGYRDALTNGTATRDGCGSVDGRPVEWLRFSETSTPAGRPLVERVAVDTRTLKPILVAQIIDGRQVSETRISAIDTLQGQTVDFSRPTLARPQPAATSVREQHVVTLADAASALSGRLLWNGATLNSLPLTSTTLQQISTSYPAEAKLPVEHARGVELAYGDSASRSAGATYVRVQESSRPQMLYRFVGPVRPQQPGTMIISTSQLMVAAAGATQATPTGETRWFGLLQQDGVYVSLEATSHELLLDAARTLTPFEATK